MISILRGLRMADEGIGERYFVPGFFGLVALVCLFEAGDSYRAHQWDRGISKTPRMSDGQPDADHLSLQSKLQVTGVVAQKWRTGGIVYDKSPMPGKDASDAIAYYFEIAGTSETSTIRDVRVQLKEINPSVRNLDWLPVLLFHKHDQPPHAEKFDLHPGDVKHIDLVSAYRGADHFEVRHIVDGVNRDVPTSGHHRLTVTITASDTPKLSVLFDVFMDSTGVLQCDIVDSLNLGLTPKGEGVNA
jgi:hypothetical protein